MDKRKVLVALSALSMLLLVGLTVNMVSGQESGLSRNKLAGGQYFVAAANLISTTPSIEEKILISQQRKEVIAKGEEFDQLATLKPDPLYSPQKFYSYNEELKEANEVKSEPVVLYYNVTYQKGVTTEKQLYLHKVISNQGIVLIPDHTIATPELIPSPNEEKYLFSDDGNIFMIDAESLEVSHISKDNVDGYDKLKIIDSLIEGQQLFWAWDPKWSLDGESIVYVSNRSHMNGRGMDIWKIDVGDGSETKIYSHSQSLRVIGWTNRNEILIKRTNDNNSEDIIEKISISGERIAELLKSVDVLDISADGTKLLYSPNRPSTELRVFDLISNEDVYTLDVGNAIQFDPTATFSPDGEKIVALKYTGVNGEREVCVVNIQSKSDQTFASSKNQMFYSDISWINNVDILINSIEDNKSKAKVVETNVGGGNIEA
ncbi:PD40 domain-containing protein [Paenibacillus paeoniae]|uniref:WD40 repeat domain-containing protein n=1 Tax=Paenibacillus paeoniae TaxID=2292705 RepID=A0A371P6I9_9BACL|nr:PD40 domain-containing protein [Paenibacillus paeoniae]REK71512.1 hypothetical protein DX130_21160 [Paenibacillus paeoniae]